MGERRRILSPQFLANQKRNERETSAVWLLAYRRNSTISSSNKNKKCTRKSVNLFPFPSLFVFFSLRFCPFLCSYFVAGSQCWVLFLTPSNFHLTTFVFMTYTFLLFAASQWWHQWPRILHASSPPIARRWDTGHWPEPQPRSQGLLKKLWERGYSWPSSMICAAPTSNWTSITNLCYEDVSVSVSLEFSGTNLNSTDPFLIVERNTGLPEYFLC